MDVSRKSISDEMNWADYFDALCSERFLPHARESEQSRLVRHDAGDGQGRASDVAAKVRLDPAPQEDARGGRSDGSSLAMRARATESA